MLRLRRVHETAVCTSWSMSGKDKIVQPWVNANGWHSSIVVRILSYHWDIRQCLWFTNPYTPMKISKTSTTTWCSSKTISELLHSRIPADTVPRHTEGSVRRDRKCHYSIVWPFLPSRCYLVTAFVPCQQHLAISTTNLLLHNILDTIQDLL